jgi:hypothetical protein
VVGAHRQDAIGRQGALTETYDTQREADWARLQASTRSRRRRVEHHRDQIRT